MRTFEPLGMILAKVSVVILTAFMAGLPYVNHPSTVEAALLSGSAPRAKMYLLAQAELRFPLKRGDRGFIVEQLQRALRKAGIYRGAINGVFNQETEAAVREAQRRERLSQTGRIANRPEFDRLVGRRQILGRGKPSPQISAPGKTVGAASPGICRAVTHPLTAIVPVDARGVPQVEQTFSDRPTFWFYIPYAPRFPRRAEFALIDEAENDVYKGEFRLDQPSGIARLQLPPTVLLEVGKRYRWVFSVLCNVGDRSSDITVNGWIERVNADSVLAQMLENSPEAKFLFLAEQRFWYEALANLAERQQANPTDENLAFDWETLLRNGRLQGLLNLQPEQVSPPFWATYRLPQPTN